MHFTQPQIKEILDEIISKKDGLNIILKLTLESLIKAERREHNIFEELL